jgi:hypothetical protein
MLGYKAWFSRVGKPRPSLNGVGRLFGITRVAIKTPIVMDLKDRPGRAEIRRRLEVVRMVTIAAAELLPMLSKMHGAPELSRDPSEMVGLVLLRAPALPRVAVHTPQSLLSEVRKRVKAFYVTFLTSDVGVIGGLFARYVHQRFFFLAGYRIGEKLGIARVTTDALELLSLLGRHNSRYRNCCHQKSHGGQH